MRERERERGKTFWRLGEGAGALSSGEEGFLLELEKDPLLRLVETMLLRSCFASSSSSGFVLASTTDTHTENKKKRERKERKGTIFADFWFVFY